MSHVSGEGRPRVLVTGARGFLGRATVGALTARGAEVLRSARPPATQGWIAADLAVDELEAELMRARPEVIVNLAGRLPGAPHSLLVRDNVLAPVRLAEAALACGVRRLVLSGSAEEYGAQAGPLAEVLPCLPRSAYGASKAAATALALDLGARSGLEVVVLRPFSVYGPGQPAAMFLAQALAAAEAGEPFEMTHGTQRRDLVYIDDAAAAFAEAALRPGLAGLVLNVGSGRAFSLAEVAELLWRLSGTRADLRRGARAARADELLDTWADTRLAEERLAFVASTSLEEGLRRMISASRGGIR